MHIALYYKQKLLAMHGLYLLYPYYYKPVWSSYKTFFISVVPIIKIQIGCISAVHRIVNTYVKSKIFGTANIDDSKTPPFSAAS